MLVVCVLCFCVSACLCYMFEAYFYVFERLPCMDFNFVVIHIPCTYNVCATFGFALYMLCVVSVFVLNACVFRDMGVRFVRDVFVLGVCLCVCS